MFGSSILEVAIGIAFIYLIFSLICTAVNELIASKLDKRAKNLEEGIKNLLNDPKFTGLAQQLYYHGLVDGISQDAAHSQKETIKPSYMANETFSMALMDILGARGIGERVAELETKAKETFDAAVASANAFLAGDALKTALADSKAAYDKATADVQSARAAKEKTDAAQIAGAAVAELASPSKDNTAANLAKAKEAFEEAVARNKTVAALKKDLDDAIALNQTVVTLQKDLADKSALGEDAAVIASAQAAYDKAVEDDPVLRDLKAAFDKAVEADPNLSKLKAAYDKAKRDDELAGKVKAKVRELRVIAKEELSKAQLWLRGRWEYLMGREHPSTMLKAADHASEMLEAALDAGRGLASKQTNPLDNIQAAVVGLPPGHTRETLLVLIDKTRRDVALATQQINTGMARAAGELDHAVDELALVAAKAAREMETLRSNIEGWFDTSMERVGGWYKRWTQKILLGIACVVVFAANADTLMLTKRLMRDNALRASLVTAATDATKASLNPPVTTTPANPSVVPPVTTTPTANPPAVVPPVTTTAPATQPGAPPVTTTSTAPKSSDEAKANLDKVIKTAESLNLPLGWVNVPGQDRSVPDICYLFERDPPKEGEKKKIRSGLVFPNLGSAAGDWLLKLIGLLMSALAVSMGAPFWFDTLSKIVNLRSAGTPPGESKKSAPQSPAKTT